MEKISKDRVIRTLKSLDKAIKLALTELESNKFVFTEESQNLVKDLYLELFHINIDDSDIV